MGSLAEDGVDGGKVATRVIGMKGPDSRGENIDLGYKNLVIAYEPVWAIEPGLPPV